MKLFVLCSVLALGLVSSQAAQATTCTTSCSIYTQNILEKISNPNPSQAEDFRAYCQHSLHGGAVYGWQLGGPCGGSGNFNMFCLDGGPTEVTQVSGWGSNEFEARQDARKSCTDRAPTVDCVNHVYVGTPTVGSFTCQ